MAKFAIIQLFAAALFAIDAVAADTKCTSPKNTSDVLSCIETHHPDMKKTESDDLLIEGIRRSARQFPNPELTVETIKGENLGDVVGEDNIAISQTIELGGKRNARKGRGEAQAELIRIESGIAKSQVRMDGILNLVKYRQLLEEIAVMEEALATFEKVNRQFAGRPKLTPDQQVTFGLFKLSIGDYRHKLAALEAEKRKAEYYFRVVPELNFAEAVKYLPKKLEKWPKFDAHKVDLAETPTMREAEANLKAADAEYELAKANAWPDPSVGFVARRVVDGTVEYPQYGVGITMPIPIWNFNGGERRQAVAQKTKAEIEYRKRSTTLSLDRQNLIKSYQAFVNSLELAPKTKDIESKHRATESLFYRGVVSGVLVIEAHRQILEFTQSQNELELETMHALLSLYFLDGRLPEFKYE